MGTTIFLEHYLLNELNKNCAEGNLDEVKNALSKIPSLIYKEGKESKLIWLFIETFCILSYPYPNTVGPL